MSIMPDKDFKQNLDAFSPGFSERHGNIIDAFDRITNVAPVDDVEGRAFLCLGFAELGRSALVQGNDKGVVTLMNAQVKDVFNRLPLSDGDKAVFKEAYAQSKKVSAEIDEIMLGHD